MRARKRASLEEIMDGLEAYIHLEITIKKTKLQYLKGPAPWLNQDGWLSDYQTEIEDAERNNPESLKTARRREGTERLAAIAREELDRTEH